MLEFGACPRCKMDIAPERKNSNPVVCNHCGFITSNNERLAQIKQENKFIKSAIIFSVVAVVSFIQVVTWDKYAFEIIPLKIKEISGMANTAEFERIAEACFDLKKYACVEQNYARVAKVDSTKLIRLGNFQMKLEKYNDAAQSYYGFFQSGGQDLEASYSYAKALSQLGKVDEAVKYFDQVIASKPETLQVTVVQSYVKLLMDHQRYDQAKKLMDDVRKSGETAGMFMESEYQKLKELTTASRD